MEKREWKARTRRDLIIEVWEHLDCESVGAHELIQIENVLLEQFGAGGMEPPARVARILADEGAELRHAEVLELDVRHREIDPYRAMVRDTLKFSSLAHAEASIRRLEELRLEFVRINDREGLRRVREAALKARQRAYTSSVNPNLDIKRRAEKAEIADWVRVWLQQPKVFEEWLDLRRSSKDFLKRFENSEGA